LYRRAVKIIICILIIGATSSSVIGTNVVKNTFNTVSYDRDILYVGGSGPNNYSKIQYAIDDASDGDTVFVFEGTYYEQIYINTTINLIGENKATTVINGSEIGVVVTINADHVNINGFTIEKSSDDYNGIDVYSDYCNISDNIFNDHGYGIYIIDTENHKITKNIFYYHYTCIVVKNSDNNLISGNTFADKYGSKIAMSDCDFNIITDNQVTYGYTFINSHRCNDLVITNNIIFGFGASSALRLFDMVNCSTSGNIIRGFNEGLWLERFNHSTINGNEISNNDQEGIYFIGNCNFNVISNNIISGNDYAGIVIQGKSSNNSIIYNTINTNPNDIYIKAECFDHIIYHNNFNDNTPNVVDLTLNIWNDSYPSGGNYWSDYTGDDNDGDGIGDITLNISGGAGNKDYYPLMYPWGEQRPVANYTYFEEYGGYMFNASLSYDRDGEVVLFEWDFDDGTTDQGIMVSHAFNESGVYNITLIVTDDEENQGNLTKTIDAVKNYPPDSPSIDGPSSGKWGKPYYFTFQSSDIEGSDIWYFVDWGDEHNTGWMGPYVSGYELSDAHTWGSQDAYVVRCKVKDVYDFESDWSEHEINIPRYRFSYNFVFKCLYEHFLILHRLLYL
jgi:parallel beta-helix repeat protein